MEYRPVKYERPYISIIHCICEQQYCFANFKYAEGYVASHIILNILNMPKNSQNICDELKSTWSAVTYNLRHINISAEKLNTVQQTWWI